MLKDIYTKCIVDFILNNIMCAVCSTTTQKPLSSGNVNSYRCYFVMCLRVERMTYMLCTVYTYTEKAFAMHYMDLNKYYVLTFHEHSVKYLK